MSYSVPGQDMQTYEFVLSWMPHVIFWGHSFLGSQNWAFCHQKYIHGTRNLFRIARHASLAARNVCLAIRNTFLATRCFSYRHKSKPSASQ